MSNFNVRPLLETDYASWSLLYTGYCNFYHVSLDETSLKRVWGWLNDPHQNIHCLSIVDEQTQQAVGLAHYRFFIRPIGASQAIYLDDLFIDEYYRHQGAAKLLFEKLKQIAITNDCTLVRWITAPDNQIAMKLYDKHADRTPWVTYDMSCTI